MGICTCHLRDEAGMSAGAEEMMEMSEFLSPPMRPFHRQGLSPAW